MPLVALEIHDVPTVYRGMPVVSHGGYRLSPAHLNHTIDQVDCGSGFNEHIKKVNIVSGWSQYLIRIGIKTW
jgi:hypothetical protein